ncbi:beta-phosphoglucomutase [Escherichia coli]|nr:beta-phosphoglucomutase [Escherichia coli]
MKLQGVIFDLDGVITDTAHLHFQAWQQIAAEIGISIDAQFNESLTPTGSRQDSHTAPHDDGAKKVSTSAEHRRA